MKGNLKINGKDARVTWGVSLADGSVSALLAPAPVKQMITNTSRLRNGKTVIRSSSDYRSLKKLADRDVSLIFNFRSKDYSDLIAKLNSLIEELLSGETVLETSYLPEMAFHLDYISCTQFSQLRGQLSKFIMKFNEPDPTNRNK